MTKQVEIDGVTYEAVPEKSAGSCSGCVVINDEYTCDRISDTPFGCNNEIGIIWIKKEPMNTTEQTTETVEAPPEEEPKYTLEEFSEAFSNVVGVHVSDWDILQIKKYLDKQSNPDYQLYLKFKKQFGE